MLYDVLTICKFLFDGTLGTWKTKPVDIELQPGANTYHDKPYPVPQAHKVILRKYVEHLCQIWAFKK